MLLGKGEGRGVVFVRWCRFVLPVGMLLVVLLFYGVRGIAAMIRVHRFAV
jgi:hypothetical protein